MPIGVHEGSSVIVPTLGSDRPFNPLILHAVSHSFEQMLACAQLIAFGVLERHPGLRVVFLESSGGWAPFWLERLDEQAESFGGFCPDLALRPSEYFARQCAISFEVDERTLPALVPFVGDDRIVWGSDYPHHDATFPGAVDALRATIAPCPTATQVKVLGLNARHLYRLPPRRPAPAGIIDDYFAAVTAHDADMLRGLFAPDAAFDVDGDRRRGHDAILAYYAGHTFGYADFRPTRDRCGSTAPLSRWTSTSISVGPSRGCETSSRPTASTSPRCACGDSPTPCEPPGPALAECRKEVRGRPAGFEFHRGSPPTLRITRGLTSDNAPRPGADAGRWMDTLVDGLSPPSEQAPPGQIGNEALEVVDCESSEGLRRHVLYRQ